MICSKNAVSNKPNKAMKESNNPDLPSHVSRRSFLKTTSTAVVGGSLLSSLPIERSAYGALSPGDTIKVALVGCGGRGSGAAGQALSTSGSVKLVAVADVHPDRMEGSLATLKKDHKDKVDVK